MRIAARRKEPSIDRESERRRDDTRGATPERMARVGSEFEVGDDQHGTKIVRAISPIERMFKRKALSGSEFAALQRFHHHWYHSGLIPGVGSVDLNRIFASDPSNSSGMPRSEAQAHHRSEYRRACGEHGVLNHRARITVDNVVCYEQSLEVAGYALGWPSKPQAIAAASEVLRDAGYRLAKLWGIG